MTADSFFIQQSWDPRRRDRVSPEHQTFTSIYYRPGFYNAKLIADTSVVREQPLIIPTDGWLALIETDPIPIYLHHALRLTGGALSVSGEWLREHGIGDGDAVQPLSFYNVRAFDSLHTDHFSLEATVRHSTMDGLHPCMRAELAVLAERGALRIPLGIPGCVGVMGVMLGDVYLDGSTHDLSAFGADLSAWQSIHILVKERNVRIQVGSNPPFTAKFTKDLGLLVGLRVSFEGTGAIDYVALNDSQGTTVYEEAF